MHPGLVRQSAASSVSLALRLHRAAGRSGRSRCRRQAARRWAGPAARRCASASACLLVALHHPEPGVEPQGGSDRRRRRAGSRGSGSGRSSHLFRRLQPDGQAHARAARTGSGPWPGTGSATAAAPSRSTVEMSRSGRADGDLLAPGWCAQPKAFITMFRLGSSPQLGSTRISESPNTTSRISSFRFPSAVAMGRTDWTMSGMLPALSPLCRRGFSAGGRHLEGVGRGEQHRGSPGFPRPAPRGAR